MAKLYFKYGAMGGSKTAQALITKFNYEEKGMTVLLIKPELDTRDGENIVKSRVGLSAEATVIRQNENIIDIIIDILSTKDKIDVIIADESQFFSEEHINELRAIVDCYEIPVICFGLRTDYATKTFSGSQRLLEVADELEEIKTMCKCGRKAIYNARIDENGDIITSGEQISLGGNDKYISMCSRCFGLSIIETEQKRI